MSLLTREIVSRKIGRPYFNYAENSQLSTKRTSTFIIRRYKIVMYYNVIFRISRAKIRVNVWTVHGPKKIGLLSVVCGGSNVHLYSFKTKSNRK